jgi:nucleoside-diphosphate-sugar epimerase
MQTALVAGGAGFIGTNLCASLLKDNFKVICLDNFISGNKKNLEEYLDHPNFAFLEQDICKEINLDQDIKIDYIFHLASPASPNKNSPRSYIKFPIETLQSNSFGTKNLLDLTKKHHAKFLFTSSSEVYGDPLVSPQVEEYWGNVSPNGVRSVYDEGKRFGEAISMAYYRQFGVDIRLIRIFNTYGPKMMADDGRVVSNFINQALKNEPLTIYGNGSQTRSFCYIDDMVLGLKKAMFSDNSKGEVFNVGNPQERTILEFAQIIKDLIKSDADIVFEELPQDDPKSRRPDISKAKRVLNWEPQISLNDGLEKTIEYFKSLL